VSNVRKSEINGGTPGAHWYNERTKQPTQTIEYFAGGLPLLAGLEAPPLPSVAAVGPTYFWFLPCGGWLTHSAFSSRQPFCFVYTTA